MPTAAEEVRVLLKGFNAQTGTQMSAVVSRSGVPMAWALPEEVQVDNFATMAATLLGALEVIFAAAKSPSPERTRVETEAGTLLLRVINPEMFFVALTNRHGADVERAVEEVTVRARDLLAKRP